MTHALLAWLFLHEARRAGLNVTESTQAPPPPSEGLSVGEALRDRALWQLAFSNFLIMALTMGLTIHLFPILTGYAGQQWLKQFISDPQAHYAGPDGNNVMPGFQGQLTDKELDLLVKWLTGDYYQSKKSRAE